MDVVVTITSPDLVMLAEAINRLAATMPQKKAPTADKAASNTRENTSPAAAPARSEDWSAWCAFLPGRSN